MLTHPKTLNIPSGPKVGIQLVYRYYIHIITYLIPKVLKMSTFGIDAFVQLFWTSVYRPIMVYTRKKRKGTIICICTVTVTYFWAIWYNEGIIYTKWARWLKRQGAELRAGRPGFDPGCRRGGDFSSLFRVQTGPGVHSASYKMSTGGFPGGKGGRA